MTNQEIAKLDEILQKHDYDPTLLIAIMQDIQKEYHYLPQEALCYIAKKLKLSEAKIYGVATFYENFSLEPKGKYVIKICDGTACHVRKSVPILEEFRKVLGVSEEKPTTEDMLRFWLTSVHMRPARYTTITKKYFSSIKVHCKQLRVHCLQYTAPYPIS